MTQAITVNLGDFESLVRADLANHEPVFAWGSPGIGKTEKIHAIGKSLGMLVHDWRANLREPVDARGLPAVDIATRQTFWAMPSDLPVIGNKLFPEGKPIILFLDELPTAAQSMQVACMQLVHERRVGEHRLRDDVFIIAAGNYQSDRAGAAALPTALRNRFTHYNVIPDVNAWCMWAANAGLHPALIAFIKFRPDLIHIMPGGGGGNIPAIARDANAYPTPRSWAKISPVLECETLRKAGNAKRAESLRTISIAGKVGEACATEFSGFLKVYESVPDLAEIVKNPKTAKLPKNDDKGSAFAVCAALSRYAKPDNFAAILQYAERLDDVEFSIMLVTAAAKRDVSIASTPAFIRWAEKNQDVTL